MTSTQAGSENSRITDDRPMTWRQITAILLVMMISILDGYDLIAMALVAPVVSTQWGIDKAVLGMLLASGLVGMAIGSLGLTPLADKVGRRPMVLGALALITLATVVSGISTTLTELLLSRVVTGIGLGTLVPLLSTMNAEFANTRSRPFVVACTSVGLPLGGAIGGLVTALVLRENHWHWVFLTGAIAGAVLFVVAALALPESPAFLIAKRPKGALERLNKILLGWGHPPLPALPEVQQGVRTGYRVMFTPALLPHVLRLGAINILLVVGGHYLMNWAPQIIAGEGFTPGTASMVSSTASMVGFAGPILLGALATRFGAGRMASLSMIAMAMGLAAVGLVPPLLTLFIIAVSAAAVGMSSSAAMFQAIVVQTFPAGVRVSAMGLVMGVGRLASGLGPYLAGVMFAAGMTRATVSLSFAALALLAAVLMMGVRPAKPALQPA